jgi:hypothetical protein
MDIQEIKRRFELLKMANNERYCLLSELAKELKVRKTDLMQFVIDNPKLFRKGSVEKKGKNMGACLFDGYYAIFSSLSLISTNDFSLRVSNSGLLYPSLISCIISL